jgi:predicted acyltransferase
MTPRNRLLSLDIFRGITIAFMIIVNTPGSWSYVYPPLRHAVWNGCTPTDLVFPAFLFIVGVSMWFSMKKYAHRLNSNTLRKILYRTAVIFLAGILIHLFPFVGKDLERMRIMGVLQRIALAYGLGSILCLVVKRKFLWLIGILILLGYWLLMWLGVGDNPFSLENNLVTRVDIAILGESHLYRGFGIPFDPEGLLSSIPAIVTVLMGFLAGELVGKGSPNGVNTLKLFIYGIAALIAGLIWGSIFPINKPLWTSSYVLFTGGISLMILGSLYYIIDVLELKGWTFFFKVFGVNALFIYIMAGLWTKTMFLIHIGSGDASISLYGWIYTNLCVPLLGNMNGSLLFALMQLGLMWLFGLLLYKKNIYIKI